MNPILAMYCLDIRDVVGYVRVIHVINHVNDEISEENIIKQVEESWDDFQLLGGGKISDFVDTHNEKYATKLEAIKITTLSA